MNDDKPILVHPAAGKRGMNELHYAAYCESLSEVKKFVESGLDVNKKDDTGYTPLAWCVDMAATAAKGEAEAIIDFLMTHGAKLEFRDDRYGDILEFARACDCYVAEHIEKLLKNEK